jgi:glutamate/tyrosine decarboxylase-like PLP-dependent enzyme
MVAVQSVSESQSTIADGYRELLPRVLSEALNYLNELNERPVLVPEANIALRELLGGPVPVSSSPAATVLDELLLGGQLGLAPTGSSRYFGYVVGGVLPVALAADWLTSVWDQVGALYDLSPLTTVLEEICAGWLVDLFGLPAGTSVSFTPACTYANLIGLAAARHSVLERHGWDIATEGLQGAPPITVVVNERIHKSVLRSLNVLGLGGNIRSVASDSEGRMLLRALDTELTRTAGGPLIVCGQVGEINTGAVEHLEPLCDRVHAARGWVHLDAAFGLWAATTDLRHTLLAGLERADSWSTDAHKWLNVPYDSGIAFVADSAAHRRAFATEPEYLQHDSPLRQPLDWGLAFSQRARVIPLWAALRQLGKDGIAQLVDRHCAQAKRFAQQLAAEPGVDVLNEVVLNQVAVRFTHPSRDSDTHTRQVAAAFQRDGVGWASTSCTNNLAILRLSIVNWATTDDDIDQAARSLIACHRSLS